MDIDFAAPEPAGEAIRAARPTTRAATAARAMAAARAAAEEQMVSLSDIVSDPLGGKVGPVSRDSSQGSKSLDSSVDRGTKRQGDSLSEAGSASDGDSQKRRRVASILLDEKIVGDTADMSADDLAAAVRAFQRAVSRVADTSKNLRGNFVRKLRVAARGTTVLTKRLQERALEGPEIWTLRAELVVLKKRMRIWRRLIRASRLRWYGGTGRWSLKTDHPPSPLPA